MWKRLFKYLYNSPIPAEVIASCPKPFAFPHSLNSKTIPSKEVIIRAFNSIAKVCTNSQLLAVFLLSLKSNRISPCNNHFDIVIDTAFYFT